MPISFQSPFSGTSPHFRYITSSYVLSMLPLPKVSMKLSSPFDFYDNHSIIKKVNKISTLKWFNKFFNSVLTFSDNNELINIPDFPDIYDIQDDEVDIKISIMNWMMEIIHPPKQDEKDIDKSNKIENENIIQRLDEKFQIVKNEKFDGSNIYDLLNFEKEIKKEININKLSMKPEKKVLEIFYENFEILISQFIEMRSPLLKTLVKNAIKDKLLDDLKKVIKIIIKGERIDLVESLNLIDHKTCLIRPNTYKGENISYGISGNELDVLSNSYDFNIADELDK